MVESYPGLQMPDSIGRNQVLQAEMKQESNNEIFPTNVNNDKIIAPIRTVFALSEIKTHKSHAILIQNR